MKRSLNEIQSMLDGSAFLQQWISDLRKDVKSLGGNDAVLYEAIKSNSKLRTSKEFAKIIVGVKEKVKDSILTLIAGNGSLILDELDGKELLSEAKDVFNYIDSDFKNYGANERGEATKETSVNVYGMVKYATFSQMFGSLSEDVRSLCLTQTQIKNFVTKHRNQLRTDGYATFFLFESNKQLFVAIVNVPSDVGFRVRVDRFEDSDVWDAERRPRVVVPQLAL